MLLVYNSDTINSVNMKYQLLSDSETVVDVLVHKQSVFTVNSAPAVSEWVATAGSERWTRLQSIQVLPHLTCKLLSCGTKLLCIGNHTDAHNKYLRTGLRPDPKLVVLDMHNLTVEHTFPARYYRGHMICGPGNIL